VRSPSLNGSNPMERVVHVDQHSELARFVGFLSFAGFVGFISKVGEYFLSMRLLVV
jgi:hypothetical protein